MAVDQEGQAMDECFLDTGRELISPNWVAWVRGSEGERPKTPHDPRY